MEWLKRLLASWFAPKPSVPILGALLDEREPEEKEKDYLQKEIVASVSAVRWTQKKWDEFRRFGVQNQDGSSSCVWQTIRKLLRVLFKVNRGIDLDFSATYGYRQRVNWPNPGTGGVDALEQCRKGITLNALLPSDNLSESQMNNAVIEQHHRDVAEDFKLPYYVQLPAGDLETLVSTIQKTQKGVMVWYFFTAEEWGRQVPIIIDTALKASDDRALRHSVAAVDGGVLVGFNVQFDGKKGVFIEDSAHFGGIFERFITEEFHKKRNFFAAYPINFKFEPDGDVDPKAKPRFTFNADLEFGMTNGDIVKLQDVLKHEGLFPQNTDSTGYFGAITKTAVIGFQKRYGIVPQSGYVGTLTRKKLNELFG